MIDANATAETQELDRLRESVAQYQSCLDRLQKLLEEDHVEIEHSMEEKLTRIIDMIRLQEQKSDALQEHIDARFSTVGEELHKEGVKVYRNVQAVVVDETTKSNTQTEEMLQRQDRRIKKIFWLALGAFTLSIASVAFQVLCYLQIL